MASTSTALLAFTQRRGHAVTQSCRVMKAARFATIDWGLEKVGTGLNAAALRVSGSSGWLGAGTVRVSLAAAGMRPP